MIGSRCPVQYAIRDISSALYYRNHPIRATLQATKDLCILHNHLQQAARVNPLSLAHLSYAIPDDFRNPYVWIERSMVPSGRSPAFIQADPAILGRRLPAPTRFSWSQLRREQKVRSVPVQGPFRSRARASRGPVPYFTVSSVDRRRSNFAWVSGWVWCLHNEYAG